MKPLLSAQSVTRYYGDRAACRDVSFDLYPGEVLAVVGESGSGKTTLLRCLSGHLPATSGTVAYTMRDGRRLALDAMSEAERRLLMRTDWGFVHQDARDGLRMGVSAGANVGERMMAVGERHYSRIRATAADWLKRVEIPEDRMDDNPWSYSGGMRQRLQIARNCEAYGLDPEIIHPPHSVDTNGPVEPVEDLDPGFFLCVSRLLPYKNLESLLQGFAQMPDERLVIVGSGPDRERLVAMAPANVTFLHDIPDAQLRWLYSSAAALFAVGLEDFGLTPIEAASFGLPTLARPFGGYLDTVIDGVNGFFLTGLEPEDLTAAIGRLRSESPVPATIRESAERFSGEEFARRMTSVVERLRSAN